MTVFSFPWSSTSGDRTVSADQARALNAAMVQNGVTTAFAGTVTGSNLTVTAGACVINGAYYDVDGSSIVVSLAGIQGNSAYIVARFTSSSRAITLEAIENNVALTRTTATWELPVASIAYSGGVWQTPVFMFEWAHAAGSSPAGTYLETARSTAPDGYLAADGAAISRLVYARLFAAISTTYGVGDGSTTFNLPDARGRVLVAVNTADTDFNAVNKTGGAKTHTLTSAQMPSHTHVQNAHSHTTSFSEVRDGASYTYDTASGNDRSFDNNNPTNAATATNQSTGGGGSHNNLQPYLTALVCIKA